MLAVMYPNVSWEIINIFELNVVLRLDYRMIM